MARSSHGTAVIAGEVQHFSASSLTLGDSDSSDGCLRKLYYEKVEGRRPPSTEAQEMGTRLHGEIEAYLRTGVNALGPLAARGKPMIPDPGPDLFIEHDITMSPHDELVARDAETEGRDAEAVSIRARAEPPLRIRGIPVVGFIDLMHQRCTNKGVSDIEDIYDPPGTVEVIDWKTTSRPMYIKTSAEMSRTIQMTLYGKWVLTTLPATTYVRLSHGYFVTKGPTAPQKITLRLLPEQIEKQWERVERVAGSIIDAVREDHADKVPANTRACVAYGGCPHRQYCRAGTQASLAAFFGTAGADNMLRRMNNVTSTVAGKNLLGFGAKKVDQPQPVMQAEMFRIAREEIDAKYPGVASVWEELTKLNVGNPHYTGELARVVGELSGAVVNVNDIPGVGKLSSYGPFSHPAELPDILEEVKAFVTTDNEPSPPELEPFEPDLIPEPEPPLEIVPLLPPETPESVPELATKPPMTLEPVTPMKRGRGRPRKDKSSQTSTASSSGSPQIYEITTGHPVTTYEDVVAVVPTSREDNLYFYVNCTPSVPFTNFWPMVHELVDDLNKASDGAVDFRLVPNEHKFAYGRWKAAITAALSTCDLTSGHYVLCGVGGEIGMAVVEAMRLVVAMKHGVFVQ